MKFVGAHQSPFWMDAMMEWERAASGRPFWLFLLFSGFFAVALARQRLFHALLLARLEIEGVPLYLFNNVFLLHFSLESTQGIL